MELNKLQILKWKARSCDHGIAVTRAGVRTGTAEVCTAISTSSENGIVRSEPMEGTIFHVQSDDTDTLSFVHNEIKRKIFNEEIGVVSQRLAIKSMKDGMPCSIGSRSTAIGLSTFPVLERLSTECTLVNFALFCTRERDAEAFELMQNRVRIDGWIVL
jgi:hypothetical protein